MDASSAGRPRLPGACRRPARLHRPLAAAALLAAAASGSATVCSASSSAPAPRVVELYTSEGCSSCPPADAWLSSLKGRRDVVALAFHVRYWDYLGWTDRFASAAATQRQAELARLRGSPSVYTPQVLVDGVDWRGWPRLPPAPAAAAAAPAVTLERRSADEVEVRVAAAAGSTRTLGGFWALVEDDHASRVRAGENAGRSLRHDHVVRRFAELPPFSARDGLVLRVDAAPHAEGRPRRLVFVLTSVPERLPLQAVVLGC